MTATRATAGRWLDPRPVPSPAAVLLPRRDRLPFPLGDPACHLFASPWQALWSGARALGLEPGDEVLVAEPAAGTHVAALELAGLRAVGYAHAPEPGGPELDARAGPRTRALYLVHRLGFAADATAWRRACDERGWLLIEDVTRAWLATRDGVAAGAAGHLAIFSFRETLGLPDGAAAVFAGAPPAPAPRAPSAFTAAMLPRLADPSIAAARRAHYAALLNGLADRVPPPFRDLPAGAAPWVLPVTGADVPSLRAAGIGSVDLRAPDTPEPARGLPVHQQLRPRDVERIARALRRGPAPRGLTADRLEPGAGAAAEWAAMDEHAGVFTTWTWLAAWREHLGAGSEPLLAALRRPDGSAAGLVALALRREGQVRVARLAGHGPADRLAPVCHPHDRPAVASALRRLLREAGADVFVGEQMPAEEGWSAALGGAVLEQEASPVLGTPAGGWEAFLARRSQNFRQQVRRRERRLLASGEFAYRLADDPARLRADLESLFALHAARWGEAGTDAFAGARAAMHHQIAARALDEGRLRLWLLEREGTPVAAWYGFRHGGAEWFYQSGRDPAAGDDAVGFVLLCHTIREAMGDGMAAYCFGRGDEAYKWRFADRDPGLETVALALTARGRAALAAWRARPVAGRAARALARTTRSAG